MAAKTDRSGKTLPPGQDEATELGIAILGWLTSQPDMMGRFLALSGLEASSIRQAAAEPGFFGGLTSFLMSHEPTLMAFCAESGTSAEHVAACHYVLNGDADGAWL